MVGVKCRTWTYILRHLTPVLLHWGQMSGGQMSGVKCRGVKCRGTIIHIPYIVEYEP